MSKILIFVAAIIASTNSYTLKFGIETLFPIQFEIPNDKVHFQRINMYEEIEILNCPDGFSFDSYKLKCTRLPDPETSGINVNDLCRYGLNGVVPYPMNCRQFVNCHYGSGTIQSCNAHLLFSKGNDRCEWPEESNCCEYMENVHGYNRIKPNSNY